MLSQYALTGPIIPKAFLLPFFGKRDSQHLMPRLLDSKAERRKPASKHSFHKVLFPKTSVRPQRSSATEWTLPFRVFREHFPAPMTSESRDPAKRDTTFIETVQAAMKAGIEFNPDKCIIKRSLLCRQPSRSTTRSNESGGHGAIGRAKRQAGAAKFLGSVNFLSLTYHVHDADSPQERCSLRVDSRDATRVRYGETNHR